MAKQLNKYKKIDKNCPLCKGSGSYYKEYGGCEYYPSYNLIRCECSLRPTKKYSKFIDNNDFIRSYNAMDSYS